MEGTLIEDTLIEDTLKEDTLKEDTLKEDTLILECYQALYLEVSTKATLTAWLQVRRASTKSTLRARLWPPTSTHSKLGRQGGCNQVYY